jgi:hypothetical protein
MQVKAAVHYEAGQGVEIEMLDLEEPIAPTNLPAHGRLTCHPLPGGAAVRWLVNDPQTAPART